MFWFWFWSVVHTLMILSDAAWWVACLRLTKKRLWQGLISVFMAAQTAGLLAIMGHVHWITYGPKTVLVAVVMWHYFALVLGVAVLLPFVVLRSCKQIVEGVARLRGVRPNPPVAAPVSGLALTRREFFGAAATLAPPLFSVGLTGVAVAQLNRFRVRRFVLPMASLPKALDGMTIAHVSDIHVGRLTCGRVLQDMVNTTNALKSDLVLLTGDLIDYSLSDLSEAIALVKAMEGRYGQWMIEGNHDMLVDGREFEQGVKAAGVPLLLNESVLAEVRGYPVQFFGLSWMGGDDKQRDRVMSFQVRELMKHRQPEAFPILLAHHPHAFDAAVKADLPLTLAGHTHGGQLMLTSQLGVGPAFFRYWSGLYRQKNSQMIVSNGVGSWFPLRVNAPAEIVHITLRCST